jgi:hypothetical protein
LAKKHHYLINKTTLTQIEETQKQINDILDRTMRRSWIIIPERQMRGRVDHQMSELGQVKRPIRAILRQPRPELEVKLPPKPKGKNLIGSKPNSAKIWIISESPDGLFIATIRTDVPANFVSRNGWRAMAGCGQQSK